MTVYAKDVLQALDDITNGRCVKSPGDWSSGKNPFVTAKTSGVPGKAVVELPGLVWGDPDMPIKKLAVLMTMTESAIELARGTGVDAIVAHHPVAEACNSGGVLFKYYLKIYNLAVFELHEAFHGTHPGIPWLHGHKPYFTSINYGGDQGCVVNVGEALPEVKTVGDLINRLDQLINVQEDMELLESERAIRKCNAIDETSIKVKSKILVGDANRPVKHIVHFHPHTGFNVSHLEQIIKEYPQIDTLLASISHIYPGDPLVAKAEELGLNFICGNSHAMEIYENGIPLAQAIKNHLPELEVVIFRERMSSIPLENVGSPEIREYGKTIASTYLKRKV
jgi:hypothetical protein